MDTLILLGDSLFQRAFSQEKDSTGQTIGSLGPRLADAYLRRLDVLNRGFSGYNTRQILSVLRSHPSILSHSPPGQLPRIVVIFLGANDARLPKTPGGPQQHVPLKEYTENLGKIVEEVKSCAVPKHIILVTPPPVDERQTVAADSIKDASLQGVVRRKAIVTAEYAMKVRQVGRDKDIAVLDLWSVMMEKAGWKGEAAPATNSGADPDDLDTEYLDEYGAAISDSTVASTATTLYDERALPGASATPVNHVLQPYLVDGLHFTRAGYDLLYDELMTLIRKKFPDQPPERLPFVVPAWDAKGVWDEKQQLKEGKERDIKVSARAEGFLIGMLFLGTLFYIVHLWPRGGQWYWSW